MEKLNGLGLLNESDVVINRQEEKLSKNGNIKRR